MLIFLDRAACSITARNARSPVRTHGKVIKAGVGRLVVEEEAAVTGQSNAVEQRLAVFTALVVLVVPTIGITVTDRVLSITETTLMWPWMILVRLQPDSPLLRADMYNFVLPPFSLLIFIPFLFALRYAYTQFRGGERKELTAGKIALMALVQMLLIFVVYASQELGVREDNTIYFIPQLLVLLVQGGFGVRWYVDTVQETLTMPAQARTMIPAGPGTSFDLSAAAPGASETYPFALPELPYASDALSDAIDAETMEIHHGRHHQGYTDGLNAALENHPELHDRTILDLLGSLPSLPEEIRIAVLNSGGGYLNHALFWPMMSPEGGGEPTGELAQAVNDGFGSLDAMKQAFNEAAGSVFGSGWAWLARKEDGSLTIVQTTEQNPPHAYGLVPVLGIDVWEHAYYLRYRNRRGEYINNWWNVVNWEQAGRNFAA